MVLFGEASGDGSDRRPGDIDPIDGSRVFSPGMQAAGRELLASGSVRARDEVFKEKLFSSYMLEKLASLPVSFFFGGAAVDGMTRWSVQLEEDRPCSRRGWRLVSVFPIRGASDSCVITNYSKSRHSDKTFTASTTPTQLGCYGK